MLKKIILVFTSLTLLCIFVFCKIENTSRIPPTIVVKKYVLKTDSLQLLTDNYFKLQTINESLKSEIKILNEQINSYNKSISDCKKRLDNISTKLSLTKKDSLSASHKKAEIKDRKLLKKLELELSAKQASLLKCKTIQQKQEAKNELITKELRLFTSHLYGEQQLKFNNTTCYVYIADLDSDLIQLHWKNENGKIYSSIQAVYDKLNAEKITPLMITNAGMYKPDQSPQGLYIEHYKKIIDLDTTKPNTNNFYLKPNGVFFLDSFNTPHIVKTEEFEKKSYQLKIKYATQSGPMLVIDGTVHHLFTYKSKNLKIRSGVGIMNEKKVVFILSMDEINFYDFSLLFKDIFNSKNALFLDGAISKMYLKNSNPEEKNGAFGAMISVIKKKTLKQ